MKEDGHCPSTACSAVDETRDRLMMNPYEWGFNVQVTLVRVDSNTIGQQRVEANHGTPQVPCTAQPTSMGRRATASLSSRVTPTPASHMLWLSSPLLALSRPHRFWTYPCDWHGMVLRCHAVGARYYCTYVGLEETSRHSFCTVPYSVLTASDQKEKSLILYPVQVQATIAEYSIDQWRKKEMVH